MLENLTDPQKIVLAFAILFIMVFLITTIVLQKKGWFDESEIDKRRRSYYGNKLDDGTSINNEKSSFGPSREQYDNFYKTGKIRYLYDKDFDGND